MDFESRIHDMLDEIDGPDATPYRFNSKFSIIEKYFKKIEEDTKKECIGIVRDYLDKSWVIIQEIKKL